MNGAIKKQLREDILQFLETITKQNFTGKYDELIQILMPYRDKGMSKEEALTILYEVYDSTMDFLTDSQDEVLLEISNRLTGYCPPQKDVHW